MIPAILPATFPFLYASQYSAWQYSKAAFRERIKVFFSSKIMGGHL
jgi:hypothetical protein